MGSPSDPRNAQIATNGRVCRILPHAVTLTATRVSDKMGNAIGKEVLVAKTQPNQAH